MEISLCISQGFLEKQNRYVCILREVYLKELAHALMGPGISQLCRVGQQAGDLGKANVSVQVQSYLLAEFFLFLLRRGQPLFY